MLDCGLGLRSVIVIIIIFIPPSLVTIVIPLHHLFLITYILEVGDMIEIHWIVMDLLYIF